MGNAYIYTNKISEASSKSWILKVFIFLRKIFEMLEAISQAKMENLHEFNINCQCLSFCIKKKTKYLHIVF
jgi:hypothetical protein